jgi:hypothetical protein
MPLTTCSFEIVKELHYAMTREIDRTLLYICNSVLFSYSCHSHAALPEYMTTICVGSDVTLHNLYVSVLHSNFQFTF